MKKTLLLLTVMVLALGLGALPALAAPITVNSTVTDAIPVGGADSWEFQGVAGQQIQVQVTAANNSWDPYIYLFGPDGTLIAQNDDIDLAGGNLNSALSLSLPTDGLYRLVVRSFLDSSGGTYTLSLTGDAVQLTPTPPANTTVEFSQLGITAQAVTNVRLRDDNSLQGTILDVVQRGDEVDVLGIDPAREWLWIDYAGQRGWSAANFYTPTTGDFVNLPVITEELARRVTTGDIVSSTVEINIREGASLDTPIVATLPFGSVAQVLGISDDEQWLFVDYGAGTGWTFADYWDVTPPATP
ncbi:MAG: SH3 domain-containing protein [Anaerolineae bacterium]|nr:SH3 domain-containing protein [Anaerolineae bacterium]